jgi:hypothetical protein
MEEFFAAVSNFGFPVVVAGYLLIRMEKTIQKMTDKVGNLTVAIDKLCDKVDSKK